MKYSMAKIKRNSGQIALNIVFILIALCYILPFILLLSVSFEGDPSQTFHLIPQKFSLEAYKTLFQSPRRIINAYGVTIFSSVVGTVLSLFLTSTLAYSLTKREFKLRNIFTFLLMFTTLFGGGLVPQYVVYSKFLNLNDTIWIYILPWAVSGWNVIVVRSNMQAIPNELIESAKLDGAGEWRTFFQIVLPLSTPILGTIGFLGFIGMWNDWYIASIYIRDLDLWNLQTLLRSVLKNMEELKRMVQEGEAGAEALKALEKLESIRFAMAVVATGPALVIFPFFQKFFSRGITVGSVKG